MLLVMLSSTDCLCVFNLLNFFPRLTYYCNSQVLYFIFKTTHSFYYGPRNIMNIPCTKCFQYFFVFLHFLMFKSLKSFFADCFCILYQYLYFYKFKFKFNFYSLKFSIFKYIAKKYSKFRKKKGPP